jgi:hypothetical protein
MVSKSLAEAGITLAGETPLRVEIAPANAAYGLPTPIHENNKPPTP